MTTLPELKRYTLEVKSDNFVKTVEGQLLGAGRYNVAYTTESVHALLEEIERRLFDIQNYDQMYSEGITDKEIEKLKQEIAGRRK